jgi:hypothetical protein
VPRARRGSLFFVLVTCAGCGSANRDTVPVSSDVAEDRTSRRSDEGYEYVARRPLAVVALAEARGIDAPLARAAVDQLADAVNHCATDQRARGLPFEGAARIVAQIDGEGRVAATSLRVDPGAGAPQTAVLCLVAPVRLVTFPPADGGTRGMAIEALWGHPAPLPAGAP